MSDNATVSPWKLIYEGWVRHTIGVIGTALVARGYLSPSAQVGWTQTAATEFIGASGMVFAYVWSAIDKRKVADWILAALHIPTTTPVVEAAASISSKLVTSQKSDQG